MLRERIVTAIFLLAVLLAALFWLPEFLWSILMLGLLLLGGREWGGLAAYSKVKSWLYGAMSAALGLLLLVFLGGGDGTLRLSMEQPIVVALLGVSLLFWLLAVPLWLAKGWHSHNPLLLAVIGWIVLVPTWLALVGLRRESPWLLLGVMATVWIADSAAYFAGRRFGKNKLAPAISPGKTWEGVAGALAGVGGYALLVSLFHGSPAVLVPAGLVLTAFSIEGDLFESWMKRQAGLKDSGAILPGHGGILDRVDALTSTLPLAALLILLLGKQ
jgi:phosphatidate cytidylyltransferase